MVKKLAISHVVSGSVLMHGTWGNVFLGQAVLFVDFVGMRKLKETHHLMAWAGCKWALGIIKVMLLIYNLCEKRLATRRYYFALKQKLMTGRAFLSWKICLVKFHLTDGKMAVKNDNHHLRSFGWKSCYLLWGVW